MNEAILLLTSDDREFLGTLVRREILLFFVKIRTISRKLKRARGAGGINNFESVELRFQGRFQFSH